MKNLSKVSSHLLRSNRRFLSSHTVNTQDAFENFDAHLLRRRTEAQRSIVVQVPSAGCAEHVFRQCSAVGQVSSFFHYTTFNKYINKQQELLLVEFLDPGCVQEMMYRVPSSSSAYLPARSPFFHYSAGSSSLASNTSTATQAAHSQPLSTLVRDDVLSDDELKQNLFSCSSISEQIQLYYDRRRLSDLGYRLRFLTCRQIELVLSGLLPHMSALPFGSSVNGFGHNRSDLDMVMQLEAPDKVKSSSVPEWAGGLELQGVESDAAGQQRVCSTRFLELVADLLRSGAPGCSKLVKILRARVPIVKYEQQLTGLDCDLSVDNWSGLYMSELLYQYQALDGRVGPLVFALRLWAKEAELTTRHPGRWITNFSLTTLALHYLVSLHILPTFDLLRKHARPEDERLDEKGMSCKYLRSLSTIASLHQQPQSTRSLSLEDLLHGFFCFYDQFNFRKLGLTINSGKVFNKPEPSAMYIQNPLDGSLNVSRNVTLEEVERFCIAVTQARYTLRGDAPQSSPNWGLLSLVSVSGQRPKLITRINLKEIVGAATSAPSTAASSTPNPSTAASTSSTAASTSSTGSSSAVGASKTQRESQQNQKSPKPPPGKDKSPPKYFPGPSQDHQTSSKNSPRNNNSGNGGGGGSRKRKEMLMRSPK